MKVFLLHRDGDPVAALPPEPIAEAITEDLELTTMLTAMGAGDGLLVEIARQLLLASLQDPEAIVYRQEAVADCLRNPAVVRELYALSGEAIEAERSVWGFGRDAPRMILTRSVQKLEILLEHLKRLRALADDHRGGFSSPAFTRFFAMLATELDDAYFAEVTDALKELKFGGGMLVSASLDAGNKGSGYTLRHKREQGWFQRLIDRSGYAFTIADRDEAGFRALSDLEDRGTNLSANALAQSVEHVLGFFTALRWEIGFYVGCLNLSERLAERDQPICFPTAGPRDELVLCARGLYDVSLTLTMDDQVVANVISADGKALVVITGANQGGKSTFLRSVGLAQLMMQCGMFVGAEVFRTNVCASLFTHYKREEDESMASGKLDEELSRMDQIADAISPTSMLLCNESFASTNEREGSEIARQIVHALLAVNVKVLFVTHMFDFASGLDEEGLDTALFLRAARDADGSRPFAITEGRPLPTSYGEDAYKKIFGASVETAAAASPAKRLS